MSDIRTKPATTEYRDGWERVFGKKERAKPTRFPPLAFWQEVPASDGVGGFLVPPGFDVTVLERAMRKTNRKGRRP